MLEVEDATALAATAVLAAAVTVAMVACCSGDGADCVRKASEPFGGGGGGRRAARELMRTAYEILYLQQQQDPPVPSRSATGIIRAAPARDDACGWLQALKGAHQKYSWRAS